MLQLYESLFDASCRLAGAYGPWVALAVLLTWKAPMSKRRRSPCPHAGDPTTCYYQLIVMSSRIGVSVGSVVVRITR